jgi:hypothetical protein
MCHTGFLPSGTLYGDRKAASSIKSTLSKTAHIVMKLPLRYKETPARYHFGKMPELPYIKNTIVTADKKIPGKAGYL